MNKIKKNFPNFVILFGLLALNCQPPKTDKNNNKNISQDSVKPKLENRNADNMEVKISVDPTVYHLSENDIVINYKLTNNSSSPVQFGSDFGIEKESDMNWVKEPFIDTIGFEDILYSIEPKESKDFQVPLLKLLKNKKMAPGIYRITKKVWLADQKKEPFQIFAEFEVK